MRNFFIIPLIFISILLSACGSAVPKMKPFKMDIQQGNVVTSKMLLQLRPGMTKSQVKFIMGTPLIIDSFHSNRWDYFYQMRQSGKVKEQRRVILDFEKDLLVRVRGDVVPQGTPGAEPAQDGNTLASAKSVNPTPVKQEGILDKLKFWKSDEKAALNDAVKPKEEKGLFESLKFWESDEVAETKEAGVLSDAAAKTAATSNSAAQAVPSLLAVPVTGVSPVDSSTSDMPAEKSIIATPVIAEPVAPENKVAEPVAEPVKTEAESTKPEVAKVVVPDVEAPKTEPPNVETKVETSKVENLAPEVVAPVIAPPAIEAIVEPAPAPEPVTVSGKDEPFIFRMDKKLNLKNLEATPAIEVNTKEKIKKVDAPPPEPAEDPGYLERILEKIGF
jgi:outer membrane protein assembly factor BamE